MPTTKLGAFCEHLIEAGWLTAIIVVPLFFSGYASTAMDADKIALFRSIVSVMIGAWLLKIIQDLPILRKRLALGNFQMGTMTLAVLGIVLTGLIATLTSIVPRDSLFGSYQRGQGLYTILTFVIFFALVAQGLRTRQQFDRLINAIILVSFPIALYGISQKYGLDPKDWSTGFNGRPGSTAGNPIFLGAYLIMVFALTLGKLITSWLATRNSDHAMQPLAQRLSLASYAVIAVTQAIAIFITDSRGPILGWFAGIVLFALLIALIGHQHRWVIGAIGLGIAGILFLIGLNLPNTPLAPLRSIPVLARLSNLANGTGEFRLFTWENAARLVSPHTPIQFPDGTPDALNALRPLFGYGLEAMPLVYTQVSPSSPFSAEAGTDRSHNATWDVWVTTGLIGLIAYQFFFLSIFLIGFGWLGLIPTPRARTCFIGLWLGLGAVGAGASILLGQTLYLGIALSAGNIVAIMICLIWNARGAQNPLPVDSTRRSDQILIAALLAGIFAHYVESQFGIDVSPTQITLWIFVGLLVVLGKAQLTTSEIAESAANGVGYATVYGILIALIQVTLLYEFIQPGEDLIDPWTVLWRGLTFNPLKNTPDYLVPGLILLIWILAIIVVVSEMPNSNRRNGLIALVAIPSILGVVFALGLAWQLAAVPVISLAAISVEMVPHLTDQVFGIIDYYTLALFVILFLATFAFTFQKSLPKARLNLRWNAVIIPLSLATLVWFNWINLTPMHAASVYRVGQTLDTSIDKTAAIVAYTRAIELAPANDAFYMTLGKSFQQQSVFADAVVAASITAQTSAEEILHHDIQTIAKWSRLDLLYAAQTMLLRARDLNPLYADHSVNLARFYQPELPVDTPTKTQLMQLADKYYQQAQRLNPNSVFLLNESAEFDLNYKNAPDAAIQKLNHALAGDPDYAKTYITLGKTYSAKNDYVSAERAFEQALKLDPQSAEAEKRLAFVYYQTGKPDLAIQSYTRYTEIAPLDPSVWEAYKNLALIYQQTGDSSQAIAQLQRAVRLAPSEVVPQLQDLLKKWQAQPSTP